MAKWVLNMMDLTDGESQNWLADAEEDPDDEQPEGGEEPDEGE